jgi:hypothetical protein
LKRNRAFHGLCEAYSLSRVVRLAQAKHHIWVDARIFPRVSMKEQFAFLQTQRTVIH